MGSTIFVVGEDDPALAEALRRGGNHVQWVESRDVLTRLEQQAPSLVIFDLPNKVEQAAVAELMGSLRAMGIGLFLIVGSESDENESTHLSEDAQEQTGIESFDPASLRELSEEMVSRPFDLEQVADRISSLAQYRHGMRVAPPPPSSRRPESVGVLDGMGEIASPKEPPAALLSYPLPNVDTSNPPGISSAPPGNEWSSIPAGPLGLSLSFEAFAGPTSVSDELEKMLAEAERRVRSEARSTSEVPSPEAEVNAILPPEVLAALDEPLEVSDGELSEVESHTPVGQGTMGGAARVPETASKQREGMDLGDLSSPAEPVTAHGEEDDWDERPRPHEAEYYDESASEDEGHEQRLQAMDVTPIPSRIGEPLPPMSTQMGTSARQDRSFSQPAREVVLKPKVPSEPVPTPRVNWSVDLPSVLSPAFDGMRALGMCIAGRISATLSFEYQGALCQAVMRDGDFVTCGSSADDETLLAFLVLRGDLPKIAGTQLAGRFPPFGRHAAAALIANGYVGQDQLWGVLRAHAEWLLGRMASTQGGTCALETEPQGRLRAEPAVFGGATGAEVLVEVSQRVLPWEDALARIGGREARLGPGPHHSLLSECALSEKERDLMENAPGKTVREALETARRPEFAAVIAVLKELGIIEIMPAIARSVHPEPDAFDPLDAEAVRKRVAARLALIQEGDYFEVLGVPRTATAYEIRRAYLEARRAFEPSRLLTAQTIDLAEDAQLIVEVLDEAFELLRDEVRRERYRRAIEAVPPRR